MFPLASQAEYGYKLAPFASEALAEAGRVATEFGIDWVHIQDISHSLVRPVQKQLPVIFETGISRRTPFSA